MSTKMFISIDYVKISNNNVIKQWYSFLLESACKKKWQSLDIQPCRVLHSLYAFNMIELQIFKQFWVNKAVISRERGVELGVG